MDYHTKCLWMKELLGRLECYNAERQSSAGHAQQHLARTIERDLGQFRRLCQSVHHDSLAGAMS